MKRLINKPHLPWIQTMSQSPMESQIFVTTIFKPWLFIPKIGNQSKNARNKDYLIICFCKIPTDCFYCAEKPFYFGMRFRVSMKNQKIFVLNLTSWKSHLNQIFLWSCHISQILSVSLATTQSYLFLSLIRVPQDVTKTLYSVVCKVSPPYSRRAPKWVGMNNAS